MKGKKIFYDEKTITAFVFFLFLIFFYGILYYLNLDSVNNYKNIIYPYFKVDDYDISGLTFEHAEKKIELLSSEILNRSLTIHVSSREVTTTLRDLGLTVDVEKTMKEVLDFQNNLSYSRKIWYINHSQGKQFKIYFSVNDEATTNYLNELNHNVGLAPHDGYFDTSEGVKYVAGVDGYEVDIEKSLDYVHEYFEGDYDPKYLGFELAGKTVPAYTNEAYLGIDTLMSSFYTEYNPDIYLRSLNLRNAVNYINGAIIEPGEVFSYYNYAGPYDKDGYVFYYKFVGNGVCQVATTVYNAALNGGHEIVTRSPHDKKSPYVAGGLDATVVSYSSGWNVDMQWRNVYDYPVYLKAYDTYGEIHVELWSNSNATGGKTYSMESVWLGGRSYESYRHTYLNGEEIDVSFIASTYYPKDENEPD